MGMDSGDNNMRICRVEELAQWIKTLAAKADYLSLISGTYTVGEN